MVYHFFICDSFFWSSEDKVCDGHHTGMFPFAGLGQSKSRLDWEMEWNGEGKGLEFDLITQSLHFTDLPVASWFVLIIQLLLLSYI